MKSLIIILAISVLSSIAAVATANPIIYIPLITITLLLIALVKLQLWLEDLHAKRDALEEPVELTDTQEAEFFNLLH
jgi:hypothetical protein